MVQHVFLDQPLYLSQWLVIGALYYLMVRRVFLDQPVFLSQWLALVPCIIK